MRKIREVLRLKYESGLHERPIARAVGIARSTASDYLTRAKAAGLTWETAKDLSDAEVERRLFQRVGQNEPQARAAVDFNWVHNAHVLSLKGPSIRKKKGLEGKNTEEKG